MALDFVVSTGALPARNAAKPALTLRGLEKLMVGNFEITQSKSGKVMFNVKASKCHVIVRGAMYSSAAAMENGIKSLMTNAADAIIDDLTEA